MAPKKLGGKTGRAGAKPPISHDDAPPVALPNASALEALPLVQFGKAWYALAAAQAAAIAVVLGCYFKLDSKIDKQEARINALINWKNDPSKFPASKNIATPELDGSTVVAPSPSAGHLPAPVLSMNVALDAHQKPLLVPVSALPPSAHSVAPPICVGKQSKRRMACEDARECWDRSAFNPDYWETIRSKVGAEQMLLCDPK